MACNISDDKKIDNLNKNLEEQTALSENDKSPSMNDSKSDIKNKMAKKYQYGACWDPLVSHDWDAAGPPGHLASTRIKRDLSSLFKEPLPGIFAIPDEKNLCLVHCLILGPFDTPYEGGFFHFAVRFGPSYPIHPPRLKLLTTDGGRVRFNPNLYANGKVCLSILGTWSGPLWSPALNLGSLLLSIQSLLNEKPYFNEPGFKSEHYFGESDKYNLFLTHETLRVAVCGQMESIIIFGQERQRKQLLPSELVDVIRDSFSDLYDDYIETCAKHKHLDGQEMTDVFLMDKKSVFGFSQLEKRLRNIKEKLSSLTSPSDEGISDVSAPSSISDDEWSASVDRGRPSNLPEGDKSSNPEPPVGEASGSSTMEDCSTEDVHLFWGEEEEADEEDEDALDDHPHH